MSVGAGRYVVPASVCSVCAGWYVPASVCSACVGRYVTMSLASVLTGWRSYIDCSGCVLDGRGREGSVAQRGVALLLLVPAPWLEALDRGVVAA